MEHAARRIRLAARLAELEADAFLVTRLPNVRYLSGFSGSNGQLLVTADGGVFFTDGRYDVQSAREVPDLMRRADARDFPRVFFEACSELGVHRVAFEGAGVTYRLFAELSEGGDELVPTKDEVERLRWVKDREEIELLRRAQAVADRGFDFITSKLAPGVTEREIAFELDVFMLRQSDGLSFETIVAFGENAAEPHHQPTDRPLGLGDVVKMDFGALAQGYHSDMTRTVVLGHVAPRLQEVYEVVRKAQQVGVDTVRAGVTGGDVDRVVRGIIADAGYGDAFAHPLGHGVGLEIHEGPSLRPNGGDELPVDAVVTVEPGVYLEGVGGVRIEDMVEVTAEGARVVPTTTKELMIL